MTLNNLRASAITVAKRLYFGSRGEPIQYGPHKLRYLVGSRPVRLKYTSSSDIVARNDAKQIQFFVDRVRPGELVFDIGAHYGEYAVLFAALVGGQGRVISFEPDVAARPMLHANVRLNGFEQRVQVEETAVFDSKSTRQLFARHGNAQSSLARTGLGGASTDEDVEHYAITTTTLDDYISDAGLAPPDYIKLDIEGAEINALRGASKTLRSRAVILCELHPYAWPEFGTSFDDLLRVIHDSGRKVRYLDGERRVEDGPSYGAVVIS